MMMDEYHELLIEELIQSRVNIDEIHDDMIMIEGNKVKGLDLSNLDLTRIPAKVEKFRELEVLILSNNRIKKIENITGLKKLRTLDLSNNLISIIEDLDKLDNLDTLDLAENQIEYLIGLESSKSISVLGLANNLIECISGLDNLHSLRVLNLSGNHIEEIKGLENLGNLEHLDLSRNSIVTVKGLYYPIILHLHGNPLSLEVLEKMVHLDSHEFITWINNLSVDIEFGSSDILGNHPHSIDEFIEEG